MKISSKRIAIGIGITVGMVFFQIFAAYLCGALALVGSRLFTLFFEAPKNVDLVVQCFYLGATFAAINIAFYLLIRKISKRRLNIKLEIVCAFAVYAVIFYISEITYKPSGFHFNIVPGIKMASTFACITSIAGFLIIWPLERRAEKKRMAASLFEQAEQPGEPDGKK